MFNLKSYFRLDNELLFISSIALNTLSLSLSLSSKMLRGVLTVAAAARSRVRIPVKLLKTPSRAVRLVHRINKPTVFTPPRPPLFTHKLKSKPLWHVVLVRIRQSTPWIVFSNVGSILFTVLCVFVISFAAILAFLKITKFMYTNFGD